MKKETKKIDKQYIKKYELVCSWCKIQYTAANPARNGKSFHNRVCRDYDYRANKKLREDSKAKK